MLGPSMELQKLRPRHSPQLATSNSPRHFCHNRLIVCVVHTLDVLSFQQNDFCPNIIASRIAYKRRPNCFNYCPPGSDSFLITLLQRVPIHTQLSLMTSYLKSVFSKLLRYVLDFFSWKLIRVIDLTSASHKKWKK